VEAQKPLLKVLICDDDPVDRKLIRAYMSHIEDREFTLFEAGTKEEIYEALQRGSVDLILMDIQMPDKSGLEWLAELMEGWLAPVVMVTGFGSEDIAAEAIQEGAIGYISKAGLSKGRLEATIERALGRWQQLQRSRANQEELERLALHDAVTGLYNRRGIVTRLDDHIKHARRYTEELSILMADIDHFKKVNDRYGHLQGDLVLATVGGLLLKGIREVDAAGRFGGEEFLVVLPRTDSPGAMVAAERLRADIAAHETTIDSSARLRVTVSIGVATFQRNDDSSALIARADAALYDAKKAGRNRVMSAKD
jgi:two-component system, cell cycle response regulator